jgi:GT2 family glycosyltransferase
MSEIQRLTIVMPVWNKDEQARLLCHRAIASVANYVQTPYELLLIDNASPCDGLPLPLLRQAVPDWGIVTLPRNVGFGPAVNIGLKLAGGEFFCQMNTDAELVEDSASMLIEVMNAHNLDVAMPEHFENCMVYGLGKSPDLMGRDWRFGAFYVARTAALRQVGGYDETFEMCYWEDTDLWARLEQCGRRIAGWRGTWVSHWGGASSHPERDRYFVENRARYEARWSLGKA